MSNIQMNAQAARLLKRYQVQTGGAPCAKVDQALTQAAQATDKPLDVKQVEKALLQAMPENKKVIQDCCKFVANYHCDNTNGSFLTQILDTRIEKDTAHVWSPPRPTPPRVRRDPYHADLQMDPRADFILMFNARDVDDKGQPLLMKIIAREKADLKSIDLSVYRTQSNKTKVEDFDVQRVDDKADFVQMKDTDETEFQFGDPLLAVSLNDNAKEISSAIKVKPQNIDNQEFFRADANGRPDLNHPVNRKGRVVGDQADTTTVVTFADRVRLELNAKDDAPDGTWLDTPSTHFEASLHVEAGYMFEPGATGTVRFMNAVNSVSVPQDDAQLLGSSSVSANVTMNRNNLRHLLSQPVRRIHNAAPTGRTDLEDVSVPASQLIFDQPQLLQVAGKNLNPLADTPVNAAGFDAAGIEVHKIPLAGDAEQNGQEVHLTLKKGFLKGLENQDVKGWKIVAGYSDENGDWQQASEAVLKNKKESEALEFEFDIGNAPAMHQASKNLEVRVFNKDGIPAERVLIPFRQINWN